ncbi:hypothetical protein PZA11_002573 [Diplocarpon coronariae]
MSSPDPSALLREVLESVKALQHNQTLLASNVDAIAGRVNVLAGMKQVRDVAESSSTPASAKPTSQEPVDEDSHPDDDHVPQSPSLPAAQLEAASLDLSHARKPSATSRIILTTYPSQSGINPLPMSWGHKDPQERGPVVVSRNHNTIRRRNAIGAHGGSYSIYYALAVASHEIKSDHKPDFTNTEPAANIGPFPQWADKKKIVSMDPLGHLAPWLFKDVIDKQNVDIRPTIAITRAHMKLPELEQSVKEGRLVPDGKVCLNDSGELAVTKFAVEPVWYLPGVAERFGIDEGSLRRSLFEHTGGSYPELITRGDIKLFLPPIDRASEYFKRTENIAGVKDMRFQALMPDILHWLGIKKIDRMLSMSNMKHDAIVGQGIPIHERVELPESWIPADSRVEIDAKITAGYFTTGHRMTEEELAAVKGRSWDECYRPLDRDEMRGQIGHAGADGSEVVRRPASLVVSSWGRDTGHVINGHVIYHLMEKARQPLYLLSALEESLRERALTHE